MSWFRSLAFNLTFYLTTAVMCFLMLWVLFLPRRLVLKVVHLWLHQIIWIEKNIGHLTYRVLGAENIPEGPCIIAAKHQSAWETFKLHILFHDPAIVLKKELLSIPIWGWYLRRSGMIPIDRSAQAKALNAMLAAGQKAAAAGRKIVIFPQGTRLAPDAFRPYKSGVYSLYKALNIPIVPMTLNSGLFWPRHRFKKKSGVITVQFLAPIAPGLSRSTLMSMLEGQLERATQSLVSST